MNANTSTNTNTSASVRFYVTNLTKLCPREALYATFVRTAPSERCVRGKGIHHALLSVLTDVSEVITEPLVEVDCGEYCIVGKPDIVSRNLVVEIKTTSKLPEKPLFSHVAQTQFYMHAVEREGLIVYIDDSWEVRKFRVDRQYPRTVFKNAEILYAAVTSCTLPEPRKSKFCGWCRYKEACSNDQIPEQMKPA